MHINWQKIQIDLFFIGVEGHEWKVTSSFVMHCSKMQEYVVQSIMES